MNSKKIWSLLLLLAMSFSIVHEYAFFMLDDNHCSVQENDHCSLQEYICELSAPDDHRDICDSCFEYHTAYILPFKRLHHSDISNMPPFQGHDETYRSRNWFELFKPPTV